MRLPLRILDQSGDAAMDLEIAEYTDPNHNPMIPNTLVLDIRTERRRLHVLSEQD